MFLIEDTPELQCSTRDLVSVLTCRHPRPIGVGDLVRDALRMRPDRIVFGELRARAAALETLKVWNTGHPGGVTTLHADSAEAALPRLEDLLGEVAVRPSRRAISQAINFIVPIRRSNGTRRVGPILCVAGRAGDGSCRLDELGG